MQLPLECDGNCNVNRPYTTNGLNQYTAAGPASFTYDDRGNLTSDGTSSFTYDSANMLKTATGGISLHYDPAGRLVEYDTSISRRFQYDGAEVAAEVDNPAGAIVRRFVRGDGADELLVEYLGAGTTNRRWLHADERGSIIAVSDDAGAATINSYDEYGIPSSGNSGLFQYTGQMWLPELGMYHYKARIYSPTLGRFLQTDPIGYGDGMNMYAYVTNDPVNGVDPSGMTRPTPEQIARYIDEARTIGINNSMVSANAGDMMRSLTMAQLETQIASSVLWGSEITQGHWEQVKTGQPATEGPNGEGVVTGNRVWVPGNTSIMGQVAVPWLEPFLPHIILPGMHGPYSDCLVACFEAGTLVATPNGLKPIEQIAVGDLVLSEDEQTGTIGPKRVIGLIRPDPKPVYELELLDGSGEVEIFRVTADHRWKVNGQGWVATADLKIGNRIETGSNIDVTVRSVSLTAIVERTYNLEVADWHTFMVGEDQVVVHNGCPKPPKNWRPPTNSPQLPPATVPDGWRVRYGAPNTMYPNGYWRLEKPMGNGG